MHAYNLPEEPGDVYTIDESDEEFETSAEAMRAAASKVAELRRSVVVYRNGEAFDVRRF